jgi:hypothetical protein
MYSHTRPSLSSKRAPHRDRTRNSRPKHLKRKQYLVKRPQSGLDAKTYWLTVSRKVTLTLSATHHSQIVLQITDPSSRQTGRLKTKSKAVFRQKKGKSKICSWAPKGCPTRRHTDWLTVSRKVMSIRFVGLKKHKKLKFGGGHLYERWSV